MSPLSACRICLAVDVRMFTIANTPLQDIYERITSIPLQSGEINLEKVCYLCHHLLKKTQAFKEKAVTADKRLRHALDRESELTEASIRLLDTSDVCSPLCASRVEIIDFVQEQPSVLESPEEVSMETLVLEELSDVGEGEEVEMLGHEDLRQSENTGLQRCDSIEIVLTDEHGTNTERNGTALEQQKETNPANEDQEPNVTVIISVVKLEDESNTEAEHLDTNENQENLIELNSQLDTAPSKVAPKEILSCEQCGVSFKSLRLLNAHSKSDHSNAFICNYCSGVFKEKRSLISHIRSHVGKVNLEMESSKSTTNKKDSKKPYRCSYCNKNFTQKQRLNEHIFLIHTKKRHRCSYCNKVFNRNQHLREHILIHTGEKPHRCSSCNKTFSRKFALKEHILTHTGKKPRRCTYCNKSFIKKVHLNNHMYLHTGKTYRCNYCNKDFTQKSNLKAHMVIHTGEKPHRCSYCNKTFSRNSTLNEHLLIHTGKKPHRCTYCKKRFTQKTHLSDHMLLHTGEKPHRCVHCDKVFTQKCNLNTHILIHTREKRHPCSYCNKTFSRKFSLNEHMLKHTRENTQ